MAAIQQVLVSYGSFPAPEYVGISKTQRTTSGTAVAVDVPAGAAQGDLIIIMMNQQISSSVASECWTPPSGWTQHADTYAKAIFSYILPAGFTSTYTFTCTTSSTHSGYAIVFRNAAYDTGDYSHLAIGDAGDKTITGITVAGGASTIIFAGNNYWSGASFPVTTSGWTSLLVDNDATGPSNEISMLTFVSTSTGDALITNPQARSCRACIFSVKRA